MLRLRVGERGLTATDKLVVEAHVESSVGGGSKSLAHFADNILRTTVVIAHRILNLYRTKHVSYRVSEERKYSNGLNSQNHAVEPVDILPEIANTYVHIDLLTITFLTAYNGSDDDQLIPRHEVADASLVLAVAGGEVEFQGCGKLGHEEEEGENGPHGGL